MVPWANREHVWEQCVGKMLASIFFLYCTEDFSTHHVDMFLEPHLYSKVPCHIGWLLSSARTKQKQLSKNALWRERWPRRTEGEERKLLHAISFWWAGHRKHERSHVWIDDSLNLFFFVAAANVEPNFLALCVRLRHRRRTGLQIRIQNVGMRFGVMRLTEKIPPLLGRVR